MKRALARLQPWINLRPDARLLGLGFPMPWMSALKLPEASLCATTVPVTQQARDAGLRICRVDATSLPFADALYDQLLLVHMLEHAPSPRRLLRECWRVLAPAGELLLLVPDRGLLPHAGPGQCFGARRLRELLADAMFETLEQHPAPVSARCFAPSTAFRLARAIKRDGTAPVLQGRAKSLVPAV